MTFIHLKYHVIVNGKRIKKYDYELQALTYCLLNGYINTGKGFNFLDDRVKIEVTAEYD